ncbi:MAG TPA: glutathione S-transferase family protein [Caulobacteraceae bacterium]|jgi:glutathione S-transferase
MELVIGDKNWSSWSMRPWLVLRRAGAEFTETVVRLNRPESPANLAVASPTAQVPVLKDGELTVWDSLAISEYAAERFPQARLWPEDPARRALGRAAAAEMHAGFRSLRGECPMDLIKREHRTLTPITQTDVRRVVRLWGDLRRRYRDGGPFLTGEWSIADAFFTPVATRFRTYGILPSDHGDDGTAGEYAETLLQQPEFLEWERAAIEDVAQGGSGGDYLHT